jgi:drug/metabolite transporter (DMT)-like permease
VIVAISLALTAAVLYGVSDFVGELVWRRATAWPPPGRWPLAGQVGGLLIILGVTILCAALLLRERIPRLQGLGLALCTASVAVVAAG